MPWNGACPSFKMRAWISSSSAASLWLNYSYFLCFCAGQSHKMASDYQIFKCAAHCKDSRVNTVWVYCFFFYLCHMTGKLAQPVCWYQLFLLTHMVDLNVFVVYRSRPERNKIKGVLQVVHFASSFPIIFAKLQHKEWTMSSLTLNHIYSSSKGQSLV